jgi:hypothetical protein
LLGKLGLTPNFFCIHPILTFLFCSYYEQGNIVSDFLPFRNQKNRKIARISTFSRNGLGFFPVKVFPLARKKIFSCYVSGIFPTGGRLRFRLGGRHACCPSDSKPHDQTE